MKRVLILLIVLISISESFSQSFYNFRKGRDFIASLGTGTASYFGDLRDPKKYIETKPNVNIGLQYFFQERISARMEVNWFRLEGEDISSESNGRVSRNLSFRSDNFELNAVAIINAFPVGGRFYQRPKLNFYGFAGIGLLWFNPKGLVPNTGWGNTPLTDAGQYVALQPLATEGVSYKRSAFVIPFGGGVKIKAGPFFNIGIEGGYRLTFTDYLDDVSTVYLDNGSQELLDNPLRRALADRRHEIDRSPLEFGNQRGDPEDNDGYFLLNLKIEFYLPAHIFSTSKSNYKKRRKVRRRPGRR